jgi:hypothetical protein
MNAASIVILKALRKLYTNWFNPTGDIPPLCDMDPDSVAQTIIDALASDKPCLIARFGSGELYALVNYLGVKGKSRSVKAYIQGKTPAWWWNRRVIYDLHTGAGFFPAQIKEIEQFCELMIRDISLVDVLGSWRSEERYFEKELETAKKVHLLFFDPFWSKTPWTKVLEGKKILVVHPFTETIEHQFKKREQLFENNLLPDFQLKTIKAVQSIAGEKTKYDNWFSALDSMKAEIDKMDYDICLVACGAYGLPLAAHAKRMGKKGFHIGGSLQLLFGIKGKRWENWNYHPVYKYTTLFNEQWVRPLEKETPQNAQKIEGACYW